jgi:hypothetical protein
MALRDASVMHRQYARSCGGGVDVRPEIVEQRRLYRKHDLIPDRGKEPKPGLNRGKATRAVDEHGPEDICSCISKPCTVITA